MELYLYEDYKNMLEGSRGRELTDILIKESLRNYGIQAETVLRTEKGKPYVDNASYDSEAGPEYAGDKRQVHFSVSHSGDFFACLIADVPVGLDIQHYRKVAAGRISRRYFTEDECRYIEEKGDEGFFFIWTRKEAYSKYTGLGLEEIMQGTSVLNRRDVEFMDFKLEKGMYCSCCRMIVKEKKDI